MFRVLVLIYLATNTFLCVRADCCHTLVVRFVLKDKSARCEDFGGLPVFSDYVSSSAFDQMKAFASEVHYKKYPTCETRPLCGDGERVTEGFFCGRGRCNMFGCGCEGGCIPGDPLESFRLVHGEKNFESVTPWSII